MSFDIQKFLFESGAQTDGHYLLTSGRHSNVYIEKFRILENPVSLDAVCKAMAENYHDAKVDIVLGAAVGGILLAGGVGRYLGVKHIFAERVEGKLTFKRGFFIPESARVLVVEDIITTGGSVQELIDLAADSKANILAVVSLVDRSQDGVEFSVPHFPMLRQPSVSWEQSECPLCKEGRSIQKPGRSGK